MIAQPNIVLAKIAVGIISVAGIAKSFGQRSIFI